MRFRVKIKELSRQAGKTIQLAGHKFKKFDLGYTYVNLRDEDNNPIVLLSECVGQIVPTKTNKKTMTDIMPIPSLIGNDFLREQGATFHFNPSDRTACLEIPPS